MTRLSEDLKNQEQLMSIGMQIFKSFIRCKYKGYLKLNGQIGIKTDFEKFDEDCISRQKNRYYQKLDSQSTSQLQLEGKLISKRTLSSGYDYLLNVSVRNDNEGIEIDCLEKFGRESSSADNSYVPILIIANSKVTRNEKLLIAYQCRVLNTLQGKAVQFGKIVFGDALKTCRIQLSAWKEKCDQIILELNRIIDNKQPPLLKLNSHCQACEYGKSCLKEAKEEDNLSLLWG